MLIYTSNKSTAVDYILLPFLSRRVQIQWISGSVATYQVRRRDQLRAFICRNDERLSWGLFANWCKEQDEYQLV